MLEQYGYPFKSKEHSLYLSVYQNSGVGKTVERYLNRPNARFRCPDKLRYQFTEDFKIKVSNKCCYKLKKDVVNQWAKENYKTITITGMRAGEGGLRASHKGCAVFDETKLVKFHPLQPLEDDFMEWYIAERKIELCRLYYPPFNFKRTGCKGCPYSVDLQDQLFIMSCYLPEERKQCEIIWGKIYNEYRRIGYRLENTLF